MKKNLFNYKYFLQIFKIFQIINKIINKKIRIIKSNFLKTRNICIAIYK